MARSRRSGGSPVLGVLIAVVVLAGVAWYLLRPSVRAPAASVPPKAQPAAPTAAAAADRIDPAQEGKPVTASGKLRVTRPPRDAQLGVAAADALVLERRVEMLQWRETCAEKRCEYALAWSADPIDSSRFRERRGHDNPPRFPFGSERFTAGEVHLGAYAVDAAFAAAGVEAVDYPVRAAQLPPNLAATFRERDGRLYAGDDPAHPAAGDLRVAYRIVPAGERSLRGVQIGSRLKPPPAG
jgi:hypothetical protein